MYCNSVVKIGLLTLVLSVFLGCSQPVPVSDTLPTFISAAPITSVVKVHDGDTIIVLFQNTSQRLRLAGIDCPESDQPYGADATEATTALALNREVTVTPTTTDRYGRIVAEVTLQDGRSLSHELVKVGACWWYRKYAAHDVELKRLETEARVQRLGLWATESPQSPWEWRARRQNAIKSAGHAYLKQQKYQEARAAFEADLQQYPENAMAHFYLGDACQGLKAWTCAEEHYEASLELNAKSSVAALAKQRARKAKVWRLLDEGKQVVNEPNVPPQQLTQAEHTLDIANKLGLDDEQRAIYHQLHVKLQQKHTVHYRTASLTQHREQSMVLVPAGEFLMGSWTGDADEQPVRRVYLDAYFFDKDQLTVGEYAKFLAATTHSAPSDWNIMSRAMHKNRPVVNVDWADAAAYCKWAGKRQPTEAEWEKAARGTDGRTYPWGDEPPTKFHGNMKKELWNNHMGLTPVGMFEDGKSPYGINDMAGNVWEWVSDWYDDDYYRTAPSRNPTGPATGISKVVRGGSWGSGPEGLRSAERETHVPSSQGYGTGFRCAKTP